MSYDEPFTPWHGVITDEDFTRALTKLARSHERKSKTVGDYHWNMANSITGEGDYTPADWGEAPQGAEWN